MITSRDQLVHALRTAFVAMETKNYQLALEAHQAAPGLIFTQCARWFCAPPEQAATFLLDASQTGVTGTVSRTALESFWGAIAESVGHARETADEYAEREAGRLHQIPDSWFTAGPRGT